MKTYLQIVQDAWLESGLSGPAPTTLVGLVGIQRRMAGWVSQAWVDVQEFRANWPWMLKEFSFTTSVGKRRYTLSELLLTNVDQFSFDRPTIYKISAGPQTEAFMDTTTNDHWYNFLRLALTPNSEPKFIFVDPATNDLLLHPVPDGEYRISLRYYQVPQVLSRDTDVPRLPPNRRWDDIIMWRALWYYAYHDGAPDLLVEAERKYEEKIQTLDNRYGQHIYLTVTPIA